MLTDAVSPLGIYTICDYTRLDASSAVRASRARRFALQRVAQDLLRATRHPKGRPWRTLNCLSYLDAQAVEIRYSAAIQRASYVGCCVCGSVWVCPVCSARICELRRVEIAAMHAVHAAAGGSALLVTYTVPHSLDDRLGELLGKRRQGDGGLAAAVKRFRQDRLVKATVELSHRVGFVRATEITYGASGWHPHYHELWFCAVDEGSLPLHRLMSDLQDRWARACVASRLPRPNARGVDVRWAWDASSYLSKIGHDQIWSAARELVSAGTKKARAGNRNPWQLLADAGDGDRAAARAFGEFASATLGQRQLVTSRGLKASMGIADKSDDELARQVDESSYRLALIDPVDWGLLLSLSYEARAALLDLAEDDGPEAVTDFFVLLRLDQDVARDFLGLVPPTQRQKR